MRENAELTIFSASRRAGTGRVVHLPHCWRRWHHGQPVSHTPSALLCGYAPNVPHFMPQYSFDFIIRHHIHETAVHANATVRHCPRVNLFRHINFIGYWRAIDIVTQRFCDFVETLRRYWMPGQGCSVYPSPRKTSLRAPSRRHR